MIRIFKNIPFHSFLIVPALIFYLYVQNYLSATFHSTLRSYGIAFVLSLIIFLISYFAFSKNKHKAAVVTTSLMLFLFFYGFIYQVCERIYYRGWWPFSEIHRYLLILFFILFLLLSYFLFRTKRTFFTFTYALNIFVLIFFAINLSRLFVAILKSESSAVEISQERKKASDTLPDIYYIILDAYANDSVLSNIYHYPDNSLTDFLSKNDFYVAKNSRTNYISTIPSLSSSLNYSYLDSLGNTENKNVIYSSKVSAYLKNKNYRIVHIRSGYSVSREDFYADKVITLDNLSEFERALLRLSIFRLDDLLGYTRYLSLKEQLSVMYNALDETGPKYVFLHIVSPHPPYVCDEEGNFKTSKRVVNVWWEPKEDYLKQLKYINKETIKFVAEILKRSKIKPVIIVQSDHGPFIQSSSKKNIYDTRSMILNAYYIPFDWKKKPYSFITPVNSFRLVFNGVFKDSIPMIKDVPLDSASVINNMNSNLILKE